MNWIFPVDDLISREATKAIIREWFPGDSINNDKRAGKGITADIDALPGFLLDSNLQKTQIAPVSPMEE
jgi:hypothetical protein